MTVVTANISKNCYIRGGVIKPYKVPLIGKTRPNFPVPDYTGYDHISVSDITMNAIDLQSASGEAPFTLFASAKNVEVTGTRDNGIGVVRPYDMLEHQWTLTYSNGGTVAIELGDELVNSRWQTINPYTDHKGGDYMVPIRRPGTYTLTLTSRAPGISNTATATITVTVPSYDHVWVDGSAGSDTNDGNDPWGFGLSTATYIESTGALTQSGAFASYDHVDATSGNYTDWFNWIYLDAPAPAVGWYRIASKSSNDTIILEDKIGSDQINVGSSNGALLTFSGSGAGSDLDTFIHLRGNGGSTEYTINDAFAFATSTANNSNRKSIGGYDGGPFGTKIIAGAGLVSDFREQLLSFRVNADGGNAEFSTCHNLELDGNGGNANECVGGNITDASQTADQHFFIDRIRMYGADGDQTLRVSIPGNPVMLLVWRCEVERYKIAAEVSQHAAFFDLDSENGRLGLVGNYFTAESDHPSLDHYCYPKAATDNWLIAYNYCHDGISSPSYAFNIDFTGSSGTDKIEYLTCVENYAEACNYLFDASGANNSPTTEGTIEKMLIARNAIDGTGHIGTIVNTFCGTQYTVIDNVSFQGTGGIDILSTQRDLVDTDIVVSRNKKFSNDSSGIIRGLDFLQNTTDNAKREFTDNECHLTHTDCRQVDSNLSFVASAVYKDNNLYSSNDSTDFFDRDGDTAENLSTFNTAVGETNTSTDPGWSDPENGDFT